MQIARSQQFIKQFKKLPAKTRQQFITRLKLFAANRTHPYLKIHRLSVQYADYQSFNVNADIRVVFKEIGDTEVLLVAIGSHSELYE